VATIRAQEDAPAMPKRLSRIAPSVPMVVLLLLIVVLIALSIALFRSSLFGDRDAQLLTLFSIAGALGGALRSFSYSLALANFTERERSQWYTEALISPVVGAVAGLIAYLIVRASLVTSAGDINREGQYLISLVAGAFALRPLGTIVERGLIRGSLSRSGILGGDVSPTVPLLDRIERMLEQRVTEGTVANYTGWAILTPCMITPGQWSLDVRFNSQPPEASDDASSDEKVAELKVVGGDDRDAVLFTVALVSPEFSATPPLLSVSAPRFGESQLGTVFLTERERAAQVAGEMTADATQAATQLARAVVVEIGQGTKTLLAARVELPTS
jgi:hypothetical protein